MTDLKIHVNYDDIGPGGQYTFTLKRFDDHVRLRCVPSDVPEGTHLIEKYTKKEVPFVHNCHDQWKLDSFATTYEQRECPLTNRKRYELWDAKKVLWEISTEDQEKVFYDADELKDLFSQAREKNDVSMVEKYTWMLAEFGIDVDDL